MLLIFGKDFSMFGVYSKSVTKMLYAKFLVSAGIFKISLLLREMQVIRYFLCVRDIGEKLLDCWIVTAAYLKKQPPEAFGKIRCS